MTWAMSLPVSAFVLPMGIGHCPMGNMSSYVIHWINRWAGTWDAVYVSESQML